VECQRDTLLDAALSFLGSGYDRALEFEQGHRRFETYIGKG
jgi:hypothetical protein